MWFVVIGIVVLMIVLAVLTGLFVVFCSVDEEFPGQYGAVEGYWLQKASGKSALETDEKVQKANSQKLEAIEALDRAHADLFAAQDKICDVMGQESGLLYEEIGESYRTVARLKEKLQAMTPRGLLY